MDSQWNFIRHWDMFWARFLFNFLWPINKMQTTTPCFIVDLIGIQWAVCTKLKCKKKQQPKILCSWAVCACCLHVQYSWNWQRYLDQSQLKDAKLANVEFGMNINFLKCEQENLKLHKSWMHIFSLSSVWIGQKFVFSIELRTGYGKWMCE